MRPTPSIRQGASRVYSSTLTSAQVVDAVQLNVLQYNQHLNAIRQGSADGSNKIRPVGYTAARRSAKRRTSIEMSHIFGRKPSVAPGAATAHRQIRDRMYGVPV